MRRNAALFTILGAVITSVAFLSCELGKQPLGPTEEETRTTRQEVPDSVGVSPELITTSNAGGVTIYVHPTELPARMDSGAIVEVVVKHGTTNTPVEGQVVGFGVTDGYIAPARDTTDVKGIATAYFAQFSDSMPRNDTVKVYAWTMVGSDTLRVARTVSLKGVKVEIDTRDEVLKGSVVPVQVAVIDAGGLPVADARIDLTIGSKKVARFTAGDGTYDTTVTRSTKGTISITAESRGAVDQKAVVFLDSLPASAGVNDTLTKRMRVFVAPSVLPASNQNVATVTVQAFNGNGNPLVGADVSFEASRGIVTASAVTNDSGKAYATFQSVPANGDAEIRARLAVGDTVLYDTTVVTLEGLAVVMDVARTNTVLGDTVPVSIWVIDAAAKPVANATVVLSGTDAAAGETDGAGLLTTFITKGGTRDAVIPVSASALGAGAVDTVYFWKSIPDTPPDPAPQRNLRIYAAKSQLRADNSDFTTVTAVYVNNQGNPAAGQTIRFTSRQAGDIEKPLGVIDSVATVGVDGRATVTLQSQPRNGVCKIYAVSENGEDRDSTTVVLAGVALQLVPERTEGKTGDVVEVEVFLKDGSGNPIGGEKVGFKRDGVGTFDGGGVTAERTTDPTGRTAIGITSSTSGAMVVRGSAALSSDSAVVTFDNNTLTLRAGKESIPTGGSTTTITATYVDGAGDPIENAWVVFATNAGLMLDDSVKTNANGRAVGTLESGTFSGTATVVAKAPTGSAETQVSFHSAAAATIHLTVSPDNIRINGGEAVLTATVRDSNENTVNAENVNFRIVNGPGGGEYITKAFVGTQDGVARSTILAGSIPSRYRAVEVVATVGNGISSYSKLTISGDPHIVTVSRPEEDTVPVPKGGMLDENTMEMFVGAVVQDINGNPVADGTKVHFSAVVSGMLVAPLMLDYWSGVDDADDEIKAVLAYGELDVPFEDINNDTVMTPGVDLHIDLNRSIAARGDDVNGDGRFDYNPGAPDYHDFYWDFNGNGRCDVGVGEPVYVDHNGVSYTSIFADLNENGIRDVSELVPNYNHPPRDSVKVKVPYSSDPTDSMVLPVPDLPAGGDFAFSLWEMRPFWEGEYFDFTTNEYAVAVHREVETVEGVAYATITYPRQLARRLFVTVNGEANGVRDRDGERFVLPLIR